MYSEKELNKLGVHSRCKFCGGPLKYKQASHTFEYKSTCKDCKDKRREHYKEKYKSRRME